MHAAILPPVQLGSTVNAQHHHTRTNSGSESDGSGDGTAQALGSGPGYRSAQKKFKV